MWCSVGKSHFLCLKKERQKNIEKQKKKRLCCGDALDEFTIAELSFSPLDNKLYKVSLGISTDKISFFFKR